MEPRLMIVDGNSIINRAYYGIRMLSTKDNVPTNAVYGFLNIWFKYIEELDPAYVCVAFDLAAPTFRHKQYEAYKATRKGMPEELAVQMPILKEVLAAMNVAMLECEEYEADDIIGTVARICGEEGLECDIVTGDKDDLQLATETTKIYLTTTSRGLTQTTVYDAAAVKQRYGVTPEEFIDVKALMGDSSDNIPGVPGIGEKTALSLIANNGSIETIYENLAGCGAKGAALKKLEDGRDLAFLSKQLATIDTHAPVEFATGAVRREDMDSAALYEILNRLEFKSLISRLGLTGQEADEAEALPAKDAFEGMPCRLIADGAALAEFAEKIASAQSFTYRMYCYGGQLAGIAVATAQDAAFAAAGLALTQEQIAQAVGPLFADASIAKVGHGVKDDIVMLHSFGYAYEGLAFDTAIGAYILEPQRTSYPLWELAESMLGIPLQNGEEFLGKGAKEISIADADAEAAAQFACREAYAVAMLQEYLSGQLQNNGQCYLYGEVELPLVKTLADMQILGVAVDGQSLAKFNAELSARIEQLSAQIYDLVGYEFNINSTKQLGEALFDKLGLPAVKKTKTGYSTDSTVLEKLRGVHPVIELLSEYRLTSKIKSTYGDGLLAVINPNTGRIHSSFNQTVTVTGRISSTEPNMQNIPVRHPLGREIRKMFVAGGEDLYLVDADYSQIELRILAHISGDEVMKQAFLDGVDIHTVTASQVLHIPPEEVTAAQRGAAKAVNFGIVYGIGEFSLSQDLGISVGEAKQYIQGYLEHYSGVRAYMERIKAEAKEQGYVTTLMGRRRYIPELSSSNHNLRAFGERVALNTPIQGTAADIIKLAMVRVHRRLREEGFAARLILQVHDELIVESPAGELERVRELLKYEMEHAMELSVPLVAEEHVGKSWYDAK